VVTGEELEVGGWMVLLVDGRGSVVLGATVVRGTALVVGGTVAGARLVTGGFSVLPVSPVGSKNGVGAVPLVACFMKSRQITAGSDPPDTAGMPRTL
jgi:hypothetical protein